MVLVIQDIIYSKWQCPRNPLEVRTYAVFFVVGKLVKRNVFSLLSSCLLNPCSRHHRYCTENVILQKGEHRFLHCFSAR